MRSISRLALAALIVTQGCESLSMRKIAEAIEYSPTAIYQHFADKDALIQEICRTDFASLASMSRQMSAITDPIERIRQMGYGYIRFAVEHPEHYRLMFMTPHKPGPAAGLARFRGAPPAAPAEKIPGAVLWMSPSCVFLVQ